jgi:hypothetical protein
MLTYNEGKSPLLLETFEEKQTERKKRILGIPILILAVIASLAMMLNVGKNFGMNNSTPVGAIYISTMGIGDSLGSIFLRWSSGWRVLLVGNFRGGCISHGHTSSWDPVAHNSGYCYGWSNVTGTTLKFKYQVDTTDGTPGDFLINEVPYKLSLSGTMFLLKEIDETIVVKQVDKDLSFFEDLLEAHAYDDIQLLVMNDTDITAFFQDEAFDDDFLRL